MAPLLLLSLAILSTSGSSPPLSFSVDNDLTLVFPSVPTYTEQQQPVLLCPACTLGGLPSLDEPLFMQGSVSAVILSTDYVPGVDVLDSQPLSSTTHRYEDFLYTFDARSGTLSVSWVNAKLVRTGREIISALRTLRFASRGLNPTLFGASFTRRVRLLAQTANGTLAYPERVQPVAIVGQNQAPLCVLTSGAPPQPPLPAVYTEGSGQPAVLWASAAALAAQLTDVDDTLLSAAEVTIVASSPAQQALLLEDWLSAWSPVGSTDPASHAIVQSPYNATSGTLRLSGLATPAQYAAALATVGYSNSNTQNPTLAPRAVALRVWDASASQPGTPPLPCATPALASVRVAPVNQAPVAAWAAGAAAVSAQLGSAVYAWSLHVPVVTAYTLFSPPAGFGVLLSDVDDSTLSGVTLSLCGGTCYPAEDVLGVSDALVQALVRQSGAAAFPYTTRYNASSCTLSVFAGGGVPGSLASLGSSISAVQLLLLPALQYSNSAASRGSVPTPTSRSICLAVTDSGVGGAVAPLASPPLNLTLTLAFPQLAPQLAVLGGAGTSVSAPSVAGRPWVVEGSLGGTPVQGGLVSAWDDNPAALLAAGSGNHSFHFFVSGGTGVNAFFIDPFLGTLSVAFNSDLTVASLGRFPTVTVTVSDMLDSQRPSSSITFTVALLESGRAPAVQPGIAPDTVPISPSFSAPALIHGVHSAACLDLSAVFLTPLVLLNVSLQWRANATAAWASFTTGTGISPLSASSSTGQSIGWSLADPPRWGPSIGMPLSPTVYCLYGTPLLFPSASTGASAASISPDTLHLSLLATPSEPLLQGALPTDPFPPPYSVRVLLDVAVNVGGCRDPAAAYSPCIKNGQLVDDNVALEAMARVHAGDSSSPTAPLVCDNFCVDISALGVCDNACAASAVWQGASAANSSSWRCPANPAGNFNPLASSDLPLPHVTFCAYPPRLFSATMLWPPLPQALATYASVNLLAPATSPSVTSPAGTGAGFSAPYLLRGTAGWGATTATLPYLTSTSIANGSALVVSAPSLMPEQQLTVLLPPPPSSTTAAGTVTLQLSVGALDALAYAWASAKFATSLSDAALSSPVLQRSRLNLTLPISLTRVSWPADVPLPPLASPGTRGPAPVLDALTLVRFTPGSGAVFPPATAPARLCYTVAPPAPHLLAAWSADPARRRYPRLYAAAQMDSSQTPGVLNTSLLHFSSPAEAVRASQAAASARTGSAYAWLPVSGYTAWEALPLSRGIGGGAQEGALWWEAGGFGAASSILSPTQGGPSVVPQPGLALPRLCASLRQLPALTVLGWSTVPPFLQDVDAPPPTAAAPLPGSIVGASWELAADVNIDCDDNVTYRVLGEGTPVPCSGLSSFNATAGTATPLPPSPAASSFPRHLTSVGDSLLLFSALSGSIRGVGRELFAVGERVSLGSFQGDRDYGAGDCATGGDFNMDALLCTASWSASGVGHTLASAAALALRTASGTSYLGYPGGYPASSPPSSASGGSGSAVLPGPPPSLIADLFAHSRPGASSSPAWLTEVAPGSGLLLFSALGVWGRELYLWDSRGLGGEVAGFPSPTSGNLSAAEQVAFGGMDTAPPAAYPAGYRRRMGAVQQQPQQRVERRAQRASRRAQASLSLASQEYAMAAAASSLAAAVGSSSSRQVFAPPLSSSLSGPRLVADLVPGSASSSPEWITPLPFATGSNPLLPSGLVAFAALAPTPTSWAPGSWSGRTLFLWAAVNSYSTSGSSPSLPVPLASLLSRYPAGGLFSDPQFLTVCAGSLYFSATSAGYGRELWRVDYNGSAGSPSLAGWLTVDAWSATRLTDIAPGADSSSPAFLTCIASSALLFTAFSPASGREVWVLNALASALPSSLQALPDIATGMDSAFPPQAAPADPLSIAFGLNPYFTLLAGSVYFTASDGLVGAELWVLPSWPATLGSGSGSSTLLWPPTPARLFSDAYPGPTGSQPAFLTVYASQLFFAATLPSSGRELCYLDTVTGATVLAANLDTWGEAEVNATLAGGRSGSGTVNSLLPLADGSSNPENLYVFHGRLWFTGDDGTGGHGVELFAYEAPAPRSSTGQAAAAVNAALDCANLGGSGSAPWVNLGPSACAQQLTPSTASSAGDSFGAALSMNPGTRFGGDAAPSVPSSFSAFQSPGAPYWSPLSNTGFTVPWQSTSSRPLGQSEAEATLGLSGGRTLAVGAPGALHGAGLAYIFEAVQDSAGGPKAWVQRAVCGAEGSIPGVPDGTVARSGGPGDAFGAAIAATSRLVLIGAPQSDFITAPPAPSTVASAGGVYAYMLSPTDGGATLLTTPAAATSSWVFQGALPHPASTLADYCSYCSLGASVAVFGNVAVAGAPGHNGNTGAVWVWVFSPTTLTWSLLQRLTPTAPAASSPGSYYGASVAASLGCIVVGAPGQSGGGAVVLWKWDTASQAYLSAFLAPMVSLADALTLQLGAFTLSSAFKNATLTTPPASSNFGAAVSLHGGVLAISAPGYSAPFTQPAAPLPGAVFTMTFTAEFSANARFGGWAFSSAWLASDSAAAGLPITASAAYSWGASVAVSSSSSAPVVLVGGPGATGGGGGYPRAGLALALTHPLGAFSPGGPGGLSTSTAVGGALLPTALLSPATPASPANALFSTSLAVAGATAAIGAPGAGANGGGAVFLTACPTAPCDASAGLFTLRHCSIGSDTVCGVCDTGPCPAGSKEVQGCSASANRQCAACTAAEVSAGVLQCLGRGGKGDTLPPAAASLAATCWEDGVCSQGLLASDVLAPSSQWAATAAAAAAGSAYPTLLQRLALSAAFAASGGAEGLWWARDLAAAWSAHIAAATDPCSGLDGSSHPPPGLAAGPWPGLQCSASGAVVGIALPAVGLHGGLLEWIRGDALPQLARVDVSHNPALTLCPARLGGGVACLQAGWPSEYKAALLLSTLDVTGCAVGGEEGGEGAARLLLALPALKM